jgi:hypothetical protein
VNPKIGLLIASIVTAIIGVYGIELSIRVSAGKGRLEYLVVVLVVIALLLLVDWWLYRSYKKGKLEK